MSRLPLLVSVPHAGLRVPEEVRSYCILSQEEICRDGDEQAAEIYAPLESLAAAFQTTDVARAILDMNRAESDRRKDGVVKTHTCWDVPVYSTFPPEDIVEALLETHHRPYHRGLLRLSSRPGVRMGVDCHTMAAQGPPVGPDPGSTRPLVCLSNADGTCPADWIEALAGCFRNALEGEVTINRPFTGGYIVRTHSRTLPWVQIELSRTTDVSVGEKSRGVVSALTEFSRTVLRV